jgi:murein DD-endopeptidase MepM/ murein hydrolase activator NlpD
VTRRAAAIVLAVALSSFALTLSVHEASALEPIDDLVTTTTTLVEELVGAVTAEVPTSTTSTTSSSTSSTTTSTSTTSTTTAPSTTTTIARTPPSTVIAATRSATTTTSTTVAVAAPPPASGSLLPTPVAALLHEAPAALPTRPGPRSTLDVLDVLAPRQAPPSVDARELAPFPVAGRAHYSDDWGAPRHGPPAHSHQGCDIFAPKGTPVIAAMDGVVGRLSTSSPLGGTSLRVTLPSGTFFYYAHLDDFAPGVREGRAVRAGDVIGFVGNTGNAATTPPHLHFEIHPRGGEATSPVPYLDRWLAEAVATAKAITATDAIDAVVRPLVAPSPEPTAAPSRTPRVAALTMTPLDARPVAAVDPTPMLALAAMVGLFTWLAPRGRRRTTGAVR